jgi:hypothetical protein
VVDLAVIAGFYTVRSGAAAVAGKTVSVVHSSSPGQGPVQITVPSSKTS